MIKIKKNLKASMRQNIQLGGEIVRVTKVTRDVFQFQPQITCGVISWDFNNLTEDQKKKLQNFVPC